MKALLCVITAVIVLAFPVYAVNALDVMAAQTYTDGTGTELQYRIYIPDGDGPFPLLLYLHGSGHRGSDNTIQAAYEPGILYRMLNSEFNDCILVAPQCPEGEQWVDTPWENGSYSLDTVGESITLRTVYELLMSLQSTLAVDETRVYVTGISMGGYGAWDLIERHPEMFAAAIPVCGAGDPSAADAIKELPIWCFHGSDDDVVPTSGTREMASALQSVSNKVYRYTEYPGVGHDCWTQVYSEPELLDWLFSQSKSGTSAPPGSGGSGNWHVAGYIAAALLLTATGFGVYGVIYSRKHREDGKI